MGFQIGNHTWHHVGVNKTDNATLEKELGYIEEKWATLGNPPHKHFVNPVCGSSPAATALLKISGTNYL